MSQRDPSRMPIFNSDATIPMAMLRAHSAQAMKNCGGQTLDVVADRGGMSADEALAILDGYEFRLRNRYPDPRAELDERIKVWEAQHAPKAKLHVLRDTNLRNIPATLRQIADSIEAGKYGEANDCAVALYTSSGGMEVFHCGEAPQPGATCVLLLEGAKQRIVMGLLEVKTCNG